MGLSLLKEFKEFAVKGNMVDIAIGVIIGAAFNKVVDVLVKQVFMPPLSLLTGEVNFQDKRIVLKEKVVVEGITQAEEIAIGYGKFIETGIEFIIIAITVFVVVKFMNSLRKKADDPKNKSETTPKDIELLHQLTELMERQNTLLEKISLGKNDSNK